MLQSRKQVRPRAGYWSYRSECFTYVVADALRKRLNEVRFLTNSTAQATTASEAEGAWSCPSPFSPHAHKYTEPGRYSFSSKSCPGHDSSLPLYPACSNACCVDVYASVWSVAVSLAHHTSPLTFRQNPPRSKLQKAHTAIFFVLFCKQHQVRYTLIASTHRTVVPGDPIVSRVTIIDVNITRDSFLQVDRPKVRVSERAEPYKLVLDQLVSRKVLWFRAVL